MGRIKELINKFIQPSESSRTFDELAVEEGLKPEALKELKATQNGAIGWKWYSEEQETPTKRGRQSGLGKVNSSRDKQPKQQIQSTQQRDSDNDRAR